MQRKKIVTHLLCLVLALLLIGASSVPAQACLHCDDGSMGSLYYPIKGTHFLMEQNGTFTVQAEAVEKDYIDTHEENSYGVNWTNRPWQWEIVHTFFTFHNNAPMTRIVMTGKPTRIGDYAFYQFYHVKKVVIPSSVREICDYSFLYTGLTSVVMPKSVTKIGEQAFPSKGLTIYYEGTPEQWAKIRCETPINATVVYNYQIEPAFTQQPKSAIVKQRNQAQFSVAVSGEAMEYLWQYSENGGESWHDVTSATQGYNTDTLTVLGEIEHNGFLYRCRVTDWTGNHYYSNGAAMAIYPVLMQINRQPQDLTVTVADPAEFSLEASGDGLTYHWEYQPAGSADWLDAASAAPAVTADTCLEASGTRYRCRITDCEGNVYYSREAKLTVYPPAPQIHRQPADITATAGHPAVMTVQADGYQLQYQWQYQPPNGTNWHNSTAATQGYHTNQLTVMASTVRNGYRYRCQITDGTGQIVCTDPVTLTVVPVSLHISQQPVNASVDQGQEAVFSVNATGATLQYQWQYQKKGDRLWYNSTAATAGYNTDTLTVKGTLARSGYKYRCRITDLTGDVLYSDPVTLTVRPVTLEITHPQDVTVKQGTRAVFTVTAPGEDLQYQWEYSINGNYWMKASSFTAGYNTSRLVVQGEAKRNSFRYRCRITDGAGNVFYSNAAQLTVETPEHSCVAANPKSQYILSGNMAVFSVKTQGNVASIQWQYQTAPGKAWYNSSSATAGYNTETLTVEAAEKRNHFRYRCLITDTDGFVHTSAEAELVVTLIQLTSQPQDQTVASGAGAVFFVVTEGDLHSCYWQYSANGGKSWYAVSSFSGHDSPVMVVPAQKSRDGFLYRCVLLDSYGNRLYSDPALLTVLPE